MGARRGRGATARHGDQEGDMAMAANQPTPVPVPALRDPIVVDAAVKSFGKVRALDGVSLSVVEGETFGLIGPNGSGKTTLIRLLLGLGQADRGAVYVLGQIG